jgi:hypothetical protein
VPFEIDPEAIADARNVEHQDFVVPDYTQLSDAVFEYPENKARVIDDPELRRTYSDALMDLHHLVDEFRFESLLALTILRDYVLKRDRGEAPAIRGSGDPELDALPLPASVITVLLSYAREPPSPATLFCNPHQQISGGRILSRWFAAQLIDSALYRGIAACDRLAILLRCQASLPVARTRGGDRRQPSFSSSDLRELDPAYARFADWKQLRELAVNDLYQFVKQERNGFTHERRRPSELHGERAMVYGPTMQEEVVPGMDAQTHYALAPGFYNVVLLPAIRLTRGAIISSALAEPPG